MTSRCIFCLIAMYMVVSLLGLSAQEVSPEASAPAAKEATTPEVRTKVIYREKSYYDFEDTLIRGDRQGPDGLNVFRKDRVKFKSQLNLNRSFMPELKSSASDAR